MCAECRWKHLAKNVQPKQGMRTTADDFCTESRCYGWSQQLCTKRASSRCTSFPIVALGSPHNLVLHPRVWRTRLPCHCPRSSARAASVARSILFPVALRLREHLRVGCRCFASGRRLRRLCIGWRRSGCVAMQCWQVHKARLKLPAGQQARIKLLQRFYPACGSHLPFSPQG